MSHMSLAELQNYKGKYPVVPIYKEIFADVRTPISVLKALKKVSKTAFLLESADNKENWGRYSFLGFDPLLEITCKDAVVTIKGAITQQFTTTEPNDVIRKLLAEYKSPRFEGLPTFTGGLVGYFGYEYMGYAEPTLQRGFQQQRERLKKASLGQAVPSFNDVDLMLFDKVIAFDHYKNKIFLIVNIRTDELETNYYKGQLALDSLANLVGTGEEADIPAGQLLSDFEGEFSEAEFVKAVEQVKGYIMEGDIFQGVLSNGQRAKFSGSLLNAYRVLRTTNPSPYMFYFSSPQLELTGASPETLVKVHQGRVDTFPIAGTMPRGKNEAEDKAYEQQLLGDEKELAEHNMLVDLGRNDLGRVCQFGSVAVTSLREIQRFSHVMHICSAVTGTLQTDKDALDALSATLPAGTLSGAPKIRAVQILQDLERSPRGIYAGAIGYLDFTGNMDTCIGIRMAVAKEGQVLVRAGAGIVRDSNPKSEYEETRNKAQSMVEAIQKGSMVTGYDIVD
ncbi:anthranilate synthase component I family protein [Veillonella sp. R32]|uniref:anthranilate synthase component I family protein n=1 Tax=Veillonella sp. R32 TaxID=2021312 RepID=UPI001389DFF8|nr:chorismate-binding protein [Veillonella sp. R32]KAF1683176.1 anthranilate synthase component I [Veillonella sp. R32]